MTETIHGVRFSTQFPFYRAAADSLALADFAPARGRIADLGCGAGLIGLLLCAKAPGCRVTGFDLAPEAVDEARENAAANGLDGQFSAVLCDLREPGRLPPAGSFHAAVSNPPYHPASGGRSPDALRDRARCAAFLPPDALCAAAGHLVRAGGDFSLVCPARLLAVYFAALARAGFSPKRLRFVRHRAQSDASLALISARRGGGAGLEILSDMIVTGPDGCETAAWRAVCDR